LDTQTFEVQTLLSYESANTAFLSSIGDIDEDGFPDILFGYDNSPMFIVTEFNNNLSVRSLSITNASNWSALQTKDIDQDGYIDALISVQDYPFDSISQGRVFYVSGEKWQTIQSGVRLEDHAIQLQTEALHSQFGHSVAMLSDRLVIAAPEYSEKFYLGGALYAFSFPLQFTRIAYIDLDGDQYGETESYIGMCLPANKQSSTPGDCADGDYNIGPQQLENCENGIDDNCDGWIDLDDRQCQPRYRENCIDQLDNDENGLIDCDDPQCFGTMLCGEALLFSEGTVQRERSYPFAEPCDEITCAEQAIKQCSLYISGSGTYRIPIEKNGYDRCDFTLELTYQGENTTCTDLLVVDSAFLVSEDCAEESTSIIQEYLIGDHLGRVNAFYSTLFPIENVFYSNNNQSYLWQGDIRSYPSE